LNDIYFFGFISIVPFTYLTFLTFWGAFGRLFNLRQSKRLLNSVDQGAMIAAFFAYLLIPQFLDLHWATTESLYTVSLVSMAAFLCLFIYLSLMYLNRARSFAEEKAFYRKVNFPDFFRNRYLLFLSLFVIVSIVATNFVEYSFLSVTTTYNEGRGEDALATFLAYFEMTIVIFSFLFDTLAQDRIIKEYGMRVSLLISPLLIGFFTICAFGLGAAFGYTPGDNFFLLFFIIVAVSKLFLSTLRETLTETTFRLYLLPVESKFRIDVQTKVTGTVTAVATLVGGGI